MCACVCHSTVRVQLAQCSLCLLAEVHTTWCQYLERQNEQTKKKPKTSWAGGGTLCIFGITIRGQYGPGKPSRAFEHQEGPPEAWHGDLADVCLRGPVLMDRAYPIESRGRFSLAACLALNSTSRTRLTRLWELCVARGPSALREGAGVLPASCALVQSQVSTHFCRPAKQPKA